MQTVLSGLIIMLITLVSDSLAPATVLAAIFGGLHFFQYAEVRNF